MRDGVKLFTAVYIPKDTSQSYPILLNRTPYSVAPYGPDTLRSKIGPSPLLARAGYIFAYQDVRGKFMSEGRFVNMRPYIRDKQTTNDVDETSDTYDTIDWLIKHIRPNNGRAGMWGISYPGFYAAMGLIDAHPALKAASPQAPIADWFIGDDMHHNGALALMLTFNFFANFGQPRPQPTREWPPRFKHGSPDGYAFFLNMGPLANANKKYFHGDIEFWNEATSHPDYDQFWQSRNILPHLKNIKPAVLVTGGWFDAEDLYGTLNIYKTIEANNPDMANTLVMGPWFHGGWARSDGDRLGDIRFGSKTSLYYQRQIEKTFFEYYLKDVGRLNNPEALCFDTGANRWHWFEQWPPADRSEMKLFLAADQTLQIDEVPALPTFDEFISDPSRPVPYTDKTTIRWGREYMVGDQRFAARRPDVLVYQSRPLADSLTLAGPLQASLFVSTSGSDADWIVKLIDVYPDSFPDNDPNPCNVRMGGYQRLLRAEIMRSRFRDSYEHPRPLIPGKITEIKITLQDVFHTFRPGHKIMVQVQSSWFPLFDRNPQKYVNIPTASAADFVKARHSVFHGPQHPSHLSLSVLK